MCTSGDTHLYTSGRAFTKFEKQSSFVAVERISDQLQFHYLARTVLLHLRRLGNTVGSSTSWLAPQHLLISNVWITSSEAVSRLISNFYPTIDYPRALYEYLTSLFVMTEQILSSRVNNERAKEKHRERWCRSLGQIVTSDGASVFFHRSPHFPRAICFPERERSFQVYPAFDVWGF